MQFQVAVWLYPVVSPVFGDTHAFYTFSSFHIIHFFGNSHMNFCINKHHLLKGFFDFDFIKIKVDFIVLHMVFPDGHCPLVTI
jgi:hypothetical protein